MTNGSRLDENVALVETSASFDVWSNFGAAQGRLGTRKRNRSNDLDLICVPLEGRRSIQLSYGRISYVDSKSFIAKKSTILASLPSARGQPLYEIELLTHPLLLI
jgi:hypothetical protein